MKQIILLCLTMIVACANLYSKNNDFSFEIPDSLKKNSDAVLLFHHQTYTRTSKANLKENCHYAITILSERGDDFARFYLGYNKSSSIEKIECTIFNSSGEKVRKIKNSEFFDHSAFDGFSLYSDFRIKQFKALYSEYPYTIEIETEINHNGFIGIPSWYALEDFRLGVKETSLTIKYIPEHPIRYKENNINTIKRTEYTEGKFQCISWKTSGITPIENERFSHPFFEQVASVSFSPGQFTYDNCDGSFTDWKSMGAWEYSLLNNDYKLTDKTKKELDDLKERYADKRELSEQVYKYMQGRTRYVGIQLGIGGYKPFSPELVDNVGYGDCKALSYYTKAMLDYVGITSIYTTIGVNNRKIVFDDFANINQQNHAILCIPFEKDTVWLECTSQRAPFNHLFEGSTGRKALLVTEKGGEVVLTPDPDMNKKENVVAISKNEKNEFVCKMKTSQTGTFYDDNFGVLFLSPKELNERLINESGISDLKLINASVNQNEKIPSLCIDKQFTTKNFTTSSGKRLFVEMSPFTSITKMPEQKTPRRNPVVISSNYTYSDSISFEIPKGYLVEFIPENKTLVSEFGSYSSNYKSEGNVVYFTQQLQLKKGTFEKEKYQDLVKFINDAAQANNSKLIFKM